MITSLRVKNFALINELNLSLEKGFSVITGETGSGKSILLGALELLLGERADFSVIGPEGDKSIVEATADLSSYELESLFNELDLDFMPYTIIRREINTSGRSRAFINDTPVQLNVLRELTGRLVNIHSQYNTLELKDKSVQLYTLDVLCGLLDLRREYENSYRNLNLKRSELNKLESSLSDAIKLKDYNEFQLNELEGLNLEKIDYSKIESEFDLLENGESIRLVTAQLYEFVQGDDGVLASLSKMRNDLDKVRHISSDLNELFERVNAVVFELKDLGSDALRIGDGIELDNSRKEDLLRSMDAYNACLRKHNLHNQEELINLKETLLSSVSNTKSLEENIDRLQSEIKDLERVLFQKAEDLHQKRKADAPSIEQKIVSLLSELKLEGTILEFKLEKRDSLSSDGISNLSFLFSANKGMEKVSIEKAASGGELSRVMLVLQKLISEKKQMPSVLFDEIDTGVSGEVAQKIGVLLNRMGEHMQLIAISHLPQVAAKASHHFKVEKVVVEDRTQSRVRKLTDNEHIEEVARLMSGDSITEAAINNAKILIGA